MKIELVLHLDPPTGCKLKRGRNTVDIPEGTTFKELAANIKLGSHGFSALVNGSVAKESTLLREGDNVYIVPIVGGG